MQKATRLSRGSDAVMATSAKGRLTTGALSVLKRKNVLRFWSPSAMKLVRNAKAPMDTHTSLIWDVVTAMCVRVKLTIGVLSASSKSCPSATTPVKNVSARKDIQQFHGLDAVMAWFVQVKPTTGESHA